MSVVAGLASNALLAKCRAKYGRRLTAAEIRRLTECRSVAEVAGCLKASVRYGEVLADIVPQSAHRGQLENAVTSMLFSQLASLCRYELSVGEWLSDYVIMTGEVRQLLSFLRLLCAGRAREYIFTLPEFWLHHSRLSFAALSQCTDYAQFLARMEGTRYYKALRPFAPLEGERLDYARIEHALYELLYSHLFELADRHLSGSSEKEMRELMGTQIDLLNFSSICRLKEYYHASATTVTSMLYPGGTLRPKVQRAMVQAGSAAEARDIFAAKTHIGKKLAEGAATRLLTAKKAQQLLRCSVNPSVVLMAYIVLAEIELHDLITIIEGVRYRLEPERISELIVIDNLR